MEMLITTKVQQAPYTIKYRVPTGDSENAGVRGIFQYICGHDRGFRSQVYTIKAGVRGSEKTVPPILLMITSKGSIMGLLIFTSLFQRRNCFAYWS